MTRSAEGKLRKVVRREQVMKANESGRKRLARGCTFMSAVFGVDGTTGFSGGDGTWASYDISFVWHSKVQIRIRNTSFFIDGKGITLEV